MRSGRALVLGATALLAGGCYSPDYGNGGFYCTRDGQCPDGYWCGSVRVGMITRKVCQAKKAAGGAALEFAVRSRSVRPDADGVVRFELERRDLDAGRTYRVYLDEITPERLLLESRAARLPLELRAEPGIHWLLFVDGEEPGAPREWAEAIEVLAGPPGA